MRALRFLRQNGRRETGATSVEYGLIAAFIAGAIVLGVVLLGQVTTDNLGEPCDALGTAGAPATCN